MTRRRMIMDNYWNSSIHKDRDNDHDVPNRRRWRLRRRPSEADTASPTTTSSTQTLTIKFSSLTGKRNFSSWWILLLLAVPALLQGEWVHVEAFVPSPTTTIKGRRTVKTRGKKQPRHPSASFATNTLTSSSSSNTVSLEWTEFFAPPPTPNSSLDMNTASTTTTATPVLFLHGLLGSKRNFSSLGTMLGAQLTTPRRIVGLDLRNHGETGPHMHHVGSMSYPEMAQDVVQWMDTHHIHKCVLVGHSMGGKVAQAISILYPDRVDGLVVLDIAPVQYARDTNPNWKAVEDILRAVARVDGDGDKRSVDKALRPAVPDPALRAFVMTNYDAHRGQWKIPVTTLVRELENIAGFELGDGGVDERTMDSSHHHSLRRQYEGDVFIIHGGQSKFVRHHHMDAIARYFPNHLLTTIRGAGHWVHSEAPDDTVALLKRFLDR